MWWRENGKENNNNSNKNNNNEGVGLPRFRRGAIEEEGGDDAQTEKLSCGLNSINLGLPESVNTVIAHFEASGHSN